MMFVTRSDYLLLASILYGLAACNSAGGAPDGAVVPPAANGGAGAPAAMSSMSASAGPGTSTGAVAMTGGAANAGASAPASMATGSAAPAAGTMAAMAGPSAAAAAGGATFAEVFNLLAGGCASGGYCHAAGGGLSKLELVDQSKAYAALVGTTAMGMTMPGAMTMGCSTSMIVRVKAGDPDNSLLMQKLNGKQTCGAQMPPNGMLKPDELELVHDWIAAGAKND